jgi:hypothetical protein
MHRYSRLKLGEQPRLNATDRVTYADSQKQRGDQDFIGPFAIPAPLDPNLCIVDHAFDMSALVWQACVKVGNFPRLLNRPRYSTAWIWKRIAAVGSPIHVT